MTENKNINIEIGTPIFMTLVFLFLKCANVIDWAWVWVFTPLYIMVGLMVIGFVVFGAKRLITYIVASFSGRGHGRGGGIA